MSLNFAAGDILRIKNYLTYAPNLRQYYEILDSAFLDSKKTTIMIRQEHVFDVIKKEFYKHYVNKDNLAYFCTCIPYMLSAVVLARTCTECTSPVVSKFNNRSFNQICLTCGMEFKLDIETLPQKNLELTKLINDLAPLPWEQISVQYNELKNEIFKILDTSPKPEMKKISPELREQIYSYVDYVTSTRTTIPISPYTTTG